jgi:hypothetical protein
MCTYVYIYIVCKCKYKHVNIDEHTYKYTISYVYVYIYNMEFKVSNVSILEYASPTCELTHNQVTTHTSGICSWDANERCLFG